MMAAMVLELSPEQIELVKSPLGQRLFLEGPAGTGKTTVGVERLLHLLQRGIPAGSIISFVPQRTLGLPYYRAIHDPKAGMGGVVDVVTVGGLARRMVELFWPLVAEEAGFGRPDQPPTFLTLETAQYYMARVVRPLLEEERYFDTVTIQRNRIYSQILDTLNKAVLVGFPYTEIGQRLKAAWIGDEAQLNVYDNVQDCVQRFRDYCVENNLLDFSLQLDVFINHLWSHERCRGYLLDRYQHLIVDNVEEFTPSDHDLLRDWLPNCQSALLIYDDLAGYRSFLGADPLTAYALKKQCDVHMTLSESFVTPANMRAFEKHLSQVMERPSNSNAHGDPRSVLEFEYKRFHPEMIDWVAKKVAHLVHKQDVPAGEIVILAPYLSDALRFALRNSLETEGILVQSHRPSRSMLEEPATRCVLTWASLAHPDWGFPGTHIDVAHALQQTIEGIDLVRAQLLAETLYRVADDGPQLLSFDQLQHEMQERVTYLFGGRYERLRIWINDYKSREPEPLDHCISRLFGEVLSQVGYGFHRNFDAAKVVANLVESIQKFRQVTAPHPLDEDTPVGKEYFQLLQDGVIAAQYVQSWTQQADDAVLLAPAYTFLLNNRPVDYQFWLNVSSSGWGERILQPLTHAHVLSRRWKVGAPWTDKDEVETNQDAMHRLLLGLLRRCRKKVYLGLSELDEQGLDQRGALLSTMQQLLRNLAGEEDVDDL